MFLFDSKMPAGENKGARQIPVRSKLSEAVAISLPSALGTYARQGLTTLEHLAIPKGLRKSGLSESAALSAYGLMQGIALPLVMFPYAVIGSFTSLLIPEIAEKKELSDSAGIRELTRRVYYYSATFSLCACGIFTNYAAELGSMVYSSTEAAAYTIALGLLVPFMYLDSAVDSLLKGIGEQVYTMKVNIADAASGLILVILLTPRLGMIGYLVTVWVCEVGNLYASINKLAKVTGVSVLEALANYIKPTIVVVLLSLIKNTVMRYVNPVISMVVFVLLYVGLVFGKEKDLHLASLK